MNILQILPSLDIGGVETGTVDLAKYLTEHGHKAITVSSGGRLVRELDAIGSRHYNLPAGKKSPVSIIYMIGKLKEIIRREDIDIVHARSRVPAVIAYFACISTGRIFITTAHGYYKKHLLSRAIGWGKYVIVASNIMAKHMVNNFRVPYDRIRLIPRGVDLARFRFRQPKEAASSEFVIGMVSRITPLKGHADFIKAVSILSRRIPKLKALIVGSSPKEKYLDDLKLLIRRLGIAKVIEFIPATEDVPSVMEKLDILVSATTTPEAFGRVIIEANASGVPVVSTKVGGVVDIIEDGLSGLFCQPQNPSDMAEKIKKLYEDKGMRARIAFEARRKVEADFNLEKMMTRTLTLYEEAVKVSNILVIKMSALGDVILAIPSLRSIRQAYPLARIKVLVGVQSRQALDGCPYINELVVCDFKTRHKGPAGLWALGAQLRQSCFDMVIDLQNSKKSHILSGLSSAGARYGYDNGKFSFALNKKIKDDAPYLDPVEHQFRTLKLAGVRQAGKRLELWPSAQDEERARKFLEDNWVKPEQDLVGINIRASARWVTKNWPSSYIAELCDRLAREHNIRVVLTGSSEDMEFSSHITAMTKSKPIEAVGKTSVMELACLIKRFRVYVTPDSAPMHIASAMKCPVIALFGPTDPARHTAEGPAGCVVICKSAGLKCSPCYSPSCIKNFACMRKITVDEVFNAMKQFVADNPAPSKEGEARKEGAG